MVGNEQTESLTLNGTSMHHPSTVTLWKNFEVWTCYENCDVRSELHLISWTYHHHFQSVFLQSL